MKLIALLFSPGSATLIYQPIRHNWSRLLLNFMIDNYFKINHHWYQFYTQLNSWQQTIAIITLWIAGLLVGGLFVAIIISLFGGVHKPTANEVNRDRDRKIKQEIKLKQQRLADEKRARNHQPYKSKCLEFLYQLFR